MDIDKKKFKIDVTKGTGSGGQHKNKVETCVTVTHIATGMKETCQDTRYKNKNLYIAYNRLLKRLSDNVERQKHELLNKKRVEALRDAGVIRTYNFPRNEVKDHRTGKKANINKVLDGKLDLLK